MEGVDKNKTALKSFFLKLTVYEGSTTGPDSYWLGYNFLHASRNGHWIKKDLGYPE